MTKRTHAVLAACLGAGIVLAPHCASAQAVYGSIYGTVTDSSGAAIPGATVTVTDETKGTTVTTKSNESGSYTVEHLIPDVYSVKVEMQGFKSYETHHLGVLADTSPKVDAPLQAGGGAETVNVNADSIPQLKTDRADVATTFDTRTVSDLPIQGRNFTSLELLLPGAQQLGWSHAASENPQASQQIQIDGQAFGGVAYELDGTDNQDPILGIIVVNPALDAITESKIATQNFDAQFGKAVAAVVTVQTKSGTNNFHGSVYDYRRSNANLARNPFTQASPDVVTHKLLPPGLYNEFGFSIGGPIKKDRAFFFGDYQGQRQRLGVSQQSTVPTTKLTNSCLSGAGCDFSDYLQLPNGAGIVYQKNGTPYPGNVIPAAEVAPQALAFFQRLQPFTPNVAPSGNADNTGLVNNFSGSGNGIFNADQWDVRGDVQVSQKIHAFGRFSRFTDTLTGKPLFGDLGGFGFGIGGFAGTSLGANDSVATGADIAISGTLLTDFRLGYYRYGINTSKYDKGTNLADQLGIKGLNTADPITSGAPEIQINDPSGGNIWYGSGLDANRCNCPLQEHEDQYQIVNNWTKIIQNHSLEFGADLRYARNLRVPSDNNRAGQIYFNSSPTSNPSIDTKSGTSQGGLGYATFALGQSTEIKRYVSTSTNAKEFQKRTFFYGQDTWRATPKLTINAGLRWELYFPETVNGKSKGGLLDLSTGFIHVAGVGKVPSNMGWDLSPGALAPRVGAAYQINPKTVIRAGYGRSFDIGVFGSIFGHVVTQNLPVLANQDVVQTGGPLSEAFDLRTGPPSYPFPLVPASGLLPAPGYAVNPKARPNSLRLPTIDAWNLSVQRSVTPTLSFTLAYVGNKGTHTLSAGDGNNTNPNEPGIFLPAGQSLSGQTLHFDPAFPKGLSPDGSATGNTTLLRRYYAGSLPACTSPDYTAQLAAAHQAVPSPGSCGWTNDISYYGDNQDTHYNALQVTVTKQFSRGLSFTSNYAWQRSINFNGSFSTWNRQAVKGRDDSQREQQEVAYGTYELPFGKNHRFGGNAPGIVNEVIGGWQVSPVVTYASGLPFTLSYGECGTVIPGDAPCYPNGDSRNLKLNVGKLDPVNHKRLGFHGSSTALNKQPFNGFTAPGLDQIGTAGRNGKFGPNFFNTDASLQKNFPIKEELFAQFRVDAYNVFNHISLANPGGQIDGGDQFITNVAPSQFPTRQLQFSVRLQF